jgi:hypothetical protein
MEPPQQAMLWPQKTLCVTDESGAALWFWSRARQMPNVRLRDIHQEQSREWVKLLHSQQIMESLHTATKSRMA